MKFKNLFFISIVSILLFSLSACGSKEKDPEPTVEVNPTDSAVDTVEPTEDVIEPTETVIDDIIATPPVEVIPAVPFEPVAGEVVDAGKISAICPDGWFFVPTKDFFSDVPDAMDPSKLRLLKGTDDDWANVPSINIAFYSENNINLSYAEEKLHYDTAVDINPFTIGTDVWEGISFLDGAQALISIQGVGAFNVSLVLEGSSDSISFTDADVLTILSSISY